MEKKEFNRIAKANGMTGGSLMVCREVLVNGLANYEAANKVGVSKSLVTHALKRFNTNVCACCNQTIRSRK